MTDQNNAHITVLSDRSGSMETVRSDTEGAINRFIQEQRKQPGRATFTLVQFDDKYEVVLDHVDLATLDSKMVYHLVPRGSTALLDAWGKSIVETGEFLASLPEDQRPGTVTFVISTDGLENASREYTITQVKAMTEEQRTKYGWEFIFLGANQDAVQVGASYGVPTGSALTYSHDAVGTQNSYASVSNAVSNRRAKGGSVTFTEEDRKNANNPASSSAN